MPHRSIRRSTPTVKKMAFQSHLPLAFYFAGSILRHGCDSHSGPQWSSSPHLLFQILTGRAEGGEGKVKNNLLALAWFYFFCFAKKSWVYCRRVIPYLLLGLSPRLPPSHDIDGVKGWGRRGRVRIWSMPFLVCFLILTIFHFFLLVTFRFSCCPPWMKGMSYFSSWPNSIVKRRVNGCWR